MRPILSQFARFVALTLCFCVSTISVLHAEQVSDKRQVEGCVQRAISQANATGKVTIRTGWGMRATPKGFEAPDSEDSFCLFVVDRGGAKLTSCTNREFPGSDTPRNITSMVLDLYGLQDVIKRACGAEKALRR